MRSASILSGILVTLFGLVACSGCGAPKAKPIDSAVARALQSSGDKAEAGPVDTVGDAGAEAAETPPEFDHSVYGELLAKHVRYDTGRVDYAALAKDVDKLDSYIATLADVDLETLSRDAQLALLINAYNAFTLKLIVENYGEITSIRDLSDPWGTKRWKLAGDTLSLDNIEHGLIRPIFKDPRIHFAVNCASIGCPPLYDEPFSGAALDEQLTKVSTDALSNPRYARVEKGKLRITKLLDWYGDDFTQEGWEPTAGSVAEWVMERSTDEVAAHVEKGDTSVSFLDYDWNLNDVE